MPRVFFRTPITRRTNRIHLRLEDSAVPIRDNLPKYGEPARLYCPAGVYEVVYDDKSSKTNPRFVINARNIDWTLPRRRRRPKLRGDVKST